MAPLNVTHFMSPGDFARASDVNQNYQDIVNWADGKIQQDNLGTMTGTITWAITSGDKAIDITSTAADGSVLIAQSSPLDQNQAIVTIDDNSAVGSGNSLALDVQSSTRGVRFSVMTEAQRDAIPSPPTGTQIYNSDANEYQYFDSERWATVDGTTGDVKFVAYTSAIPAGWLDCTDGPEVSETTYAKLFAKIGTIYNTGGEAVGIFRLPNLSRRVIMGSGGTQVSGPANTVGSTGGAETHALAASEGAVRNHKHSVNILTGGVEPGGALLTHTHSFSLASIVATAKVAPGINPPTDIDVVTAIGAAPPTTFTTGPNDVAHTHDVSGVTADPTNQSGAAHNNVQPSLVLRAIIKA